jgi:hypothetical protein
VVNAHARAIDFVVALVAIASIAIVVTAIGLPVVVETETIVSTLVKPLGAWVLLFARALAKIVATLAKALIGRAGWIIIQTSILIGVGGN